MYVYVWIGVCQSVRSLWLARAGLPYPEGPSVARRWPLPTINNNNNNNTSNSIQHSNQRNRLLIKYAFIRYKIWDTLPTKISVSISYDSRRCLSSISSSESSSCLIAVTAFVCHLAGTSKDANPWKIVKDFCLLCVSLNAYTAEHFELWCQSLKGIPKRLIWWWWCDSLQKQGRQSLRE